MVHRLNNRNKEYIDNSTSKLLNNQATINATEGATALNINNVVEENTNVQESLEQGKIDKPINEPSFENISMENAAYLQNIENVDNENHSENETDIPAFEVDSIELATPELFTDKEDNSFYNQDIDNEKETTIFENAKSKEEIATKEPEMFEESNLEENFEIPAFLRRQKN